MRRWYSTLSCSTSCRRWPAAPRRRRPNRVRQTVTVARTRSRGMTMKRSIWLLAAVTALPGAASAATLIHAGHLIDGVANAATDAVTIVVDGKDIKTVE